MHCAGIIHRVKDVCAYNPIRQDRIIQLETELFAEVRSRVGEVVTRLQDSGAGLATADVLAGT